MQAQLMNLGWSSTYIGAVSYMKLVSTTTTLGEPIHFSRSAPGASRRRRAHSMFWKRSPIFAPIAMATRCGSGVPEDDAEAAPELEGGGAGVEDVAGLEDVAVDAVDDLKSLSVRVTSTSADSAPRIALGFEIRTVAAAVLSSRKDSTVCATSDARASTVRYFESSTNWVPCQLFYTEHARPERTSNIRCSSVRKSNGFARENPLVIETLTRIRCLRCRSCGWMPIIA